ncbi:MAG: hypothetical protein WCK89_06560 [bacterium]
MYDASGNFRSGASRRDLFRTSALAVSALAMNPGAVIAVKRAHYERRSDDFLSFVVTP